jgi:hypothetical protein
MTIALGVMCDDGVVLGVDLQYTQDATKTPGQKMFWLCPGKPYSVLIAAAGNPDSAKEVAALSESSILATYPDSLPTTDQIKACIQAALKRVYFEHIDPAPVKERYGLQCDLLVGIRVGYDVSLFHSNRTLLVQDKDTKCLGIGLFFSNYALASMLPLMPSVDIAAQVVTYTIALAKDFVEGIGHGSDVHMLYSNGRHDSFTLPEQQEIESAFGVLFGNLQAAITCIDTDVVPDDGVALRAQWLGDAINNLRSLQRKRRTRSWRARVFGAPEFPQSTTHDPQAPPPLQELPEGSDES